MSANVYNVIWADDECDTLSKDNAIRQLFDDNNIEVLKYVSTSEALKIAIESYKDKIDAVIVDGNFSKTDVEYVDRSDISGLIHTVSFIELFNVKRDIPFFLYTARKVLLEEICKNGELDYFKNTERLIQKGNIEELVNRIKNDVDHIHSIEFIVKKKYQTLISIAEELDEQSGENLHQFLLDEARDRNFDKSVDMFGKLRAILEVILDSCKDNQIVPEIVNSLNDFKRYWTLDFRTHEWFGYNNYYPKDGVMPKAIACSLGDLIDVLQDGSHKKQDLNLHVSEYVTEAKSPFLFRACLYLVMDILRWYHDINEKLINGEIQSPLYVQHSRTY